MPNEKLNTYYFQGIRFVPSYGDTDWDECELKAANEKEAWERLDKLTKMFTWRSVGLTHINGVKVVKETV